MNSCSPVFEKNYSFWTTIPKCSVDTGILPPSALKRISIRFLNKKRKTNSSFFNFYCSFLFFPLDVAAHAGFLKLFLWFACQQVFKSDNQIFAGNFFGVSGPRIVHLSAVDEV